MLPRGRDSNAGEFTFMVPTNVEPEEIEFDEIILLLLLVVLSRGERKLVVLRIGKPVMEDVPLIEDIISEEPIGNWEAIWALGGGIIVVVMGRIPLITPVLFCSAFRNIMDKFSLLAILLPRLLRRLFGRSIPYRK